MAAADQVFVGRSFGGFTVPLMGRTDRRRLLVLVAGMVPAPGETAWEYVATTGWEDAVAQHGRT